jgi:hypothetical protein
MDKVRCQILNITHQDGPFELLAPAFNLSSCRTKSAGIYGKLKTMVVKLASPTIHDQLFLVLVPGYSVEPHTVLDHIWQNYSDADGVQHRLGALVYYTTFLNAIRSFYDLEEYPINITGIFMAHINPTYAKGFRSNYPDHGKIRSRMALNQRHILTNMLTALIKTKNEVSNILDIVGINQQGGEQFLASSHHAASSTASLPSNTERTLDWYSKEGASSKKLEDGTKLEYFGCGGPHPWSKSIRGTYKILCPNANQPGVANFAKLNIRDFQAREKRRLKEFRKHKNMNTINWEDIPCNTVR